MKEFEEQLISEALSYYPLIKPQIEFLRHNENITCRVTDATETYVLRIHRPEPGFENKIFELKMTSEQLFQSEVNLLLHLKRSNLFPVQEPIRGNNGAYVSVLSDGSPAVLLRWLEGTPLEKSKASEYAYDLGVLAAQIHKAVEGFSEVRLEYSHALIKAMQSEVVYAQELKHMTMEQANICNSALSEIDNVMAELDNIPNSKCLIHADLNFGNVLQTPCGFAPIDFSLSGYGYKVQECGMIASNYQDPVDQNAICEGYQKTSGMAIDPHHMQSFYALSILLFITSQHNRFYDKEWYAPAMNRWCRDNFEPLVLLRPSKKSFIMN